MRFQLAQAIEILGQTPYTLMRMLDGLSGEWTNSVDDQQEWAPYDVHDLNHIRQIVTWMAVRYSDEVGPWRAYLSILQ